MNAAKQILNSMLANTDGNGDHYLDDGATITVQKDGELDVDYQIVTKVVSTRASSA